MLKKTATVATREFTFRAMDYQPTKASRAFIEEFSQEHYPGSNNVKAAALIRQTVEEMCNQPALLMNYSAYTEESEGNAKLLNLAETYTVKTDANEHVFTLALHSGEDQFDTTGFSKIEQNSNGTVKATPIKLPQFVRHTQADGIVTSSQLQHEILNLVRMLSNFGTFSQRTMDTARHGKRHFIHFASNDPGLTFVLAISL
jgi:hypothetical protein